MKTCSSVDYLNQSPLKNKLSPRQQSPISRHCVVDYKLFPDWLTSSTNRKNAKTILNHEKVLPQQILPLDVLMIITRLQVGFTVALFVTYFLPDWLNIRTEDFNIGIETI